MLTLKIFLFRESNFEKIEFIEEVTREFLKSLAKNKDVFDIVNRIIYFTSKIFIMMKESVKLKLFSD